MNDVFLKTCNVDVQEGLLDFRLFCGIEIPGIYNQDQKYDDENTQTITKILKP